jgi:hypothetical protein
MNVFDWGFARSDLFGGRFGGLGLLHPAMNL